MKLGQLEGLRMRLLGLVLFVLAAFTSGCGGDKSAIEPNPTQWDEYVAWDVGLSRLDPATATWVTGFAAAIPPTIPAYALPQVHFAEKAASQSSESGLVVSLDADGVLRTSFVVGNPSSRPNRSESVVCLRNQGQVPCAPDVDLWSIEVPGESMAFLALEIEASDGDRIDVLHIPRDQAGYPFAQAVAYPLFVNQQAKLTASAEVRATSRVWPFDGCGFASVLEEEPPIESHPLPVSVSRNEPLYLLLELCEPNEVIRLVGVGDRRVVVPVPEDEWLAPVKVLGTTALLRIDPSWFKDFDEFQVLVVRDTFGGDRGAAAWFSDAVTFEDTSPNEHAPGRQRLRW